jgi:hypothetical protein
MNEEDEISGEMSNSLKIALEDIVVVERTKLNPKISSRKKKKEDTEVNGSINIIKLASKGYKGEHQLNAEDRKTISLMIEKKEKKKGWAMLCC